LCFVTDVMLEKGGTSLPIKRVDFIIFIDMLGLALYIFAMIVFFSNVDNNEDSSENKH